MAAESEYWKRFWTKRVNRRRLIQTSAIGGAGLAAAGVVGCGDDDDGGTATATGTPAPTGEATPTPAPATPKAGGTLRGPLVGLSTGNPPSLDANRQLTFLAQIPAAYHYNRLVKFVPPATVDVNGYPSVPIDFSEVEGDCCDLPEVIDDTTFNFTLRDNLTFHDIAPVSGRAATPDDLQASLELFATESPNRGNWLAAVASTETGADGTTTVTLNKPFAPAFQVLFGNTDGGPWLYPTEVIDDETLSNTRPIGAGPFQLDEWDEGVSMTWSKHPNHYEAGKPYVDGFTASLVGDPQVILENLKSGDFDTSLWSAERWDDGLSDLPDHQWFTGPEHVWGGAYFNFAEAPFNDIRVRQAFSMSIDRPGILGALDQPMGSGLGSGLTHVSQYAQFWVDAINDASTFGDNAQYFEHNVSAAQDLLGQAGYGSGVDLTAVTSSVYGAGYLSQMQAVTASAQEAGFRSEINQQEYGAYISTTFFGELAANEFGLAPLMGSPMDPHNIFFTIFHPSSSRHNYGPHGDPHGIPAADLPVAGDEGPSGDAEMLSLFSAQAEELDFDARVEMIHQIQNYLAGKMYFVPWTGNSTAYAFAPHVKGIQLIRGYGYGSEVAPNIWLDV